MYKSYASYFISYLLANLKEKEKIKQIILFGSVAKEEATKQSDVDIFIELKKEDKSLKSKLEVILEDFYKSREGLLFKTKGIINKINIIIGKLDDYKDLRHSIESTGIVLYGHYTPSGIKGKKYLIISWESIGKNRGAFLNKVYGFKVKGKEYSGLMQQLGGKKMGKSSIIVPIESSKDILDLVKKHQVNAKTLEIYSENI